MPALPQAGEQLDGATNSCIIGVLPLGLLFLVLVLPAIQAGRRKRWPSEITACSQPPVSL